MRDSKEGKEESCRPSVLLSRRRRSNVDGASFVMVAGEESCFGGAPMCVCVCVAGEESCCGGGAIRHVCSQDILLLRHASRHDTLQHMTPPPARPTSSSNILYYYITMGGLG